MPKRRIPKNLEQMSTASLEKLLLLDFQSQDSDMSDMSSLFRAAEILAEREGTASSANADRAWELFAEKYLPFTGAGSALYNCAETQSVSAPAVQPAFPFCRKRPPPTRAAVRRTARFAACLLFGVFLSGCLFLAFDPVVRASFSGWAREFNADRASFSYTAPEADSSSAESMVRFYAPSWLPEGYVLSNLFDPGDGTVLLYEGDGTYGLVFQYMPASRKGPEVHTDTLPQTVAVSGTPADLYLPDEPGQASMLVWSDEETGLLFSLTAVLPAEDLLQIAESVRPGEAPPLPYCPTWLPEGYQELSKSAGSSTTSFSWKNEEGSLLLYTHASAPSKQQEVEKQQSAVEGLAAQDVLVNGGPASYYQNPDGLAYLIWTGGSDGTYWISGSLPLEDLIRMAEGVTPGP